MTSEKSNTVLPKPPTQASVGAEAAQKPATPNKTRDPLAWIARWYGHVAIMALYK